jgi:glycosyltransferase involved in cell wall biosynthesis
MTDPPAVTVILPTYNSSGTLRLALESLRIQSFRDLEVWVVGDGCTDDSESVVASAGDRFRWRTCLATPARRAGPERGLRRARGIYRLPGA